MRLKAFDGPMWNKAKKIHNILPQSKDLQTVQNNSLSFVGDCDKTTSVCSVDIEAKVLSMKTHKVLLTRCLLKACLHSDYSNKSNLIPQYIWKDIKKVAVVY